MGLESPEPANLQETEPPPEFVLLPQQRLLHEVQVHSFQTSTIRRIRNSCSCPRDAYGAPRQKKKGQPKLRSSGKSRDLAPVFVWIRHVLHGDHGGVEPVPSIIDPVVSCAMVANGLNDRQPERMPQVEVPAVLAEKRRDETVIPDGVQRHIPVIESRRVLHLQHGTVPAEFCQHGHGSS